MIVCKFGGTSVQDAAAMLRLAKIVTARQHERPVVVVSALARPEWLVEIDGTAVIPD